jgi:hypothetical protein
LIGANMAVAVSEGGKNYSVSERENGRFWYLNNKLHRELGPAIENIGGGVWYYEGVKMPCHSQKEFEQLISLKKQAAALQWFDVKIDSVVQCVQTYRVQATTPEEALTKTKTAQARSTQYKLHTKKNTKATITNAGTTLVRLIKNLIG